MSFTEEGQTEEELSLGERMRSEVLFGACKLRRHFSGDVQKSVLYLGLEVRAGDINFE